MDFLFLSLLEKEQQPTGRGDDFTFLQLFPEKGLRPNDITSERAERSALVTAFAIISFFIKKKKKKKLHWKKK